MDALLIAKSAWQLLLRSDHDTVLCSDTDRGLTIADRSEGVLDLAELTAISEVCHVEVRHFL